jgi:beta-lactamase regulating signal transducer with metallopeptidase domain
MGTTIQMTSRQIDETTLIESSTTINTKSETSSSTTNALESTTLIIVMPATTQPSDDNTVLIGGIVGGVVALLLIIGLIAFIVSRNRRSKNKSVENTLHQKDVPMTPASNYAKIETIAAYEKFAMDTAGYEVGNINNYGIANANIASDANYEKSNIEL